METDKCDRREYRRKTEIINVQDRKGKRKDNIWEKKVCKKQ